MIPISRHGGLAEIASADDAAALSASWRAATAAGAAGHVFGLEIQFIAATTQASAGSPSWCEKSSAIAHPGNPATSGPLPPGTKPSG
jgi:hypothetical protein